MLIDDAIHDKFSLRTITGKTAQRIRMTLNTTKRYMFDAKASEKLYQLVVDEAPTVFEFCDMAIPPFPNTYIEIDYSQYPKMAEWMKTDKDDPPASRMGFLYCNDGVTYIVAGDDKGGFFTPFIYVDAEKADATLNSKSTLYRFIQTEDFGSNQYDKVKSLLIAGLDPLSENYDRIAPTARLLTRRYEIGIGWDFRSIPSKITDETISNIMSKQAVQCSGGMRIGTGAILLLNQRRITTTYEHRTSPRIVRGKLLPSPAFHEVVIDLDAKHETFHKIFSEGPTVRQRYHEVSGYWGYYDCASQCQHNWIEFRSINAEKMDIEKHGKILIRQICTLCGGRRTRKLNYTKGDINLGKVEKTYKVTASRHTGRKGNGKKDRIDSKQAPEGEGPPKKAG